MTKAEAVEHWMGEIIAVVKGLGFESDPPRALIDAEIAAWHEECWSQAEEGIREILDCAIPEQPM